MEIRAFFCRIFQLLRKNLLLLKIWQGPSPTLWKLLKMLFKLRLRISALRRSPIDLHINSFTSTLLVEEGLNTRY
jgi:hypothetical protein